MSPKFPEVCLNVKRQFVRGIDSSGCEIYIPVNTTHMPFQLVRQKELQDFLDSQPSYAPPDTPQLA